MPKNNHTSHLENQTSPYLQQHVYNPVDWYPWGDEAFKKAQDEDKMIFLSIGYSTCHWCHVMAHESFESDEVANILKDNYIAIKVDREERPDIDNVYMNVCQALTGGGGWPLTVIMTAEKKPFFAGTYFPKHTIQNRIGIIEVLMQIATLWNIERKALLEQSAVLMNHFNKMTTSKAQTQSNEFIFDTAYEALKTNFDKTYGGFSVQPKFPTPHNLLFLMRYSVSTGNKNALAMTETTLSSMYEGGIFDHVGYGFSRYATDSRWLIPHFEKMLYDNALLTIAYSEAYTLTGKVRYRDIAQKTLDYLLHDMKSPDGAFYAAQDADSEGVEGKYYVFSYTELAELLDAVELKLLKDTYNVTEHGNFEGNNILNKIGTSDKESTIEKQVIKKLYDYRQKRVPPFLDDKILASWNGLMIAALSTAGQTIDKKYLTYAEETTDFIFTHMVDDDYKLYTSYKDGKRSDSGFLQDYANMIWGLVALYKATRNITHLECAVMLCYKMILLFLDTKTMRFFMNEKDSEELPMRPKDDYDGAMPSGNSVAVMSMITLYNLTHDMKLKGIIDEAIKAFSHNVEKTPTAYMHYVSALLLYNTPHRQVVITGENQSALYEKIIKVFLPHTTVIYVDGSDRQQLLIPDVKNYPESDYLKAYVCEDYVCKYPITDEKVLMKLLIKDDTIMH
ncbi:MAG: thioredoxin domain-containing protein [Clostridiales bacterium]|nr:thioredoxin domain-containing protein [Clostridiales bacterium]